MPLPPDYDARVYAGVLGKIIGVYAGRPVENWTHARIAAELGEVRGYVNDRLGLPLIVPDDDITGTFTFLRALEDASWGADLTPQDVAEAWLNYIVEERTILWWGGLGNSTEHTAYLRLRGGVPAPRSGSAVLNGRVVAEQIGAQIFIDGWGMVAPGDPALAARLARAAASVSHDGEAVHAAVLLAAMEALAFVEDDLNRIYDAALAFIPGDSVIARLVGDLRAWRGAEPDWRVTRERIEAEYGYDRYGGLVHVVPNHALVQLALLYADGDFTRAMLIANTSGWDTDCNAGNVGCFLGIQQGLAAFEGQAFDWRSPVADRLYLPSAEGGRAVSDALTVAGRVAALGQRLAGETPVPPGGGARFHFSQPGSVQGFRAGGDGARVENVGGRALRLTPGGGEAVFLTPTFVPPDMLRHEGYGLVASPALHPGQTVRATLLPGDVAGVEARLVVRAYGPGDTLRPVFGPPTRLTPGEHHLAWQVPDTGGWPVAEVGVALRGAGDGALLGRLSWDGAPDVTLARPPGEGESWRRAWVNAVDVWEARFPEAYRMSHNRGRGLLLQGAEAWRDYRAEATLTPVLAEAFGLVVRAGGLRRYYALLLRRGGALQLVKVLGEETVLAETSCPWSFGEARGFALEVRGAAVWAWLDGELLLEARDGEEPLPGGAVGLVCEEGTVTCEAVRVTPLRGDVSRPRGDPISRPPSP